MKSWKLLLPVVVAVFTIAAAVWHVQSASAVQTDAIEEETEVASAPRKVAPVSDRYSGNVGASY